MAFSCFFKLLLGGKLPSKASHYLPERAESLAVPPESKPVEKPSTAPAKPKAPRQSRSRDHKDGALALLGLLQRKGRFVDFLNEDIDGYDDADIGAAARDIHRGCRQILKDHVQMEAVMPGEEDSSVKVPDGFDPGEVRLTGQVDGKPPFHGVLRHHGWRATKVKLPTLSEGVDRHVIAPAEVEIQA